MIEIAFVIATLFVIAAAIANERGLQFAAGHFFSSWNQRMEEAMGPRPSFYLVVRNRSAGWVRFEVGLPGGLALYFHWWS